MNAAIGKFLTQFDANGRAKSPPPPPPKIQDVLTRPKEVKVRYFDRQGEVQERLCSGVLATCVQHEIDHLNGVLFIDYLTKLKRDRVLKKFTKLAKRAE